MRTYPLPPIPSIPTSCTTAEVPAFRAAADATSPQIRETVVGKASCERLSFTL